MFKKQTGFAPIMPLLVLALALGVGVYIFQNRQLKQGEPTRGITARTVTYCSPGGKDLKMDLHRPTGKANGAAVLWVHGGGWRAGNRKLIDRFEPYVKELQSQGYLVASIDYRLGPQNQMPAMIQDTFCAVKYLKSQAQELNIEASKIGAMGASAGGHLVAALATAYDEPSFQPDQYEDQSAEVNAVVDMFGPIDLTTMPTFLTPGQKTAMTRIFGDLGTATLAKYSPDAYINAADKTPLLILHGDADRAIPLSQSQNFQRELSQAGVESSLTVVKGAAHGFPLDRVFEPSAEELAEQIADFFDSNL